LEKLLIKKYCQKYLLKEKAYLKVGEHDLHSIKELKNFEVLFVSLFWYIQKALLSILVLLNIYF